MIRFMQVDLKVTQFKEMPVFGDVRLYNVVLSGPGIDIVFAHTASYFDINKKFVVSIKEME